MRKQCTSIFFSLVIKHIKKANMKHSNNKGGKMKKSYTKKIRLLVLITLFTFLSIPSNINAWAEEGETPTFEENISLPGQESQTPLYVPGEVLVKFKEGVDPQSVLQEVNLQAQAVERVHSIAVPLARFKTDYKIEKEFDGWYWFLGKNYREAEDVPDEELFKEVYSKMGPQEQGLYRSYKVVLPERISVEDSIAILEATPYVEYAEPNYIFGVQATPLPQKPYIPNDYYIKDSANPGYWRQDILGNTYKVPDLWGLQKIHVIEAWNCFDTNRNGVFDGNEKIPGEGVVVAVVDSGVDYLHEDIAANIWVNSGEDLNRNGRVDSSDFNGRDDDGNGYVDDIRGYDIVDMDSDPSGEFLHGQLVAGIIAAVGNNRVGIIGVAFGAKIMSVRVLAGNGTGNFEQLIQGIKYAADNGADILNCSVGSISRSSSLEESINYAHDVKGCIIVASAGNKGDANVHYPAAYQNAIAVASTSWTDYKSSFSNYGEKIDVSAPGSQILSLGRPDPPGPGPSYLISSGTSFASPLVAGLAALIKSKYPAESSTEIRNRIIRGTDNIDSLNSRFGWHLGSGRINALNSLLSPADFDKDGDVDVFDLMVFADSWHMREGESGYNLACDLAGPNSGPPDGYIDVWDLMAFQTEWSPTPVPVPAPEISQISPYQTRAGRTATISGSDFGARNNDSRVHISGNGSSVYATIVSWSNNLIRFRVPGLRRRRARYMVRVDTGAGGSNNSYLYYY